MERPVTDIDIAGEVPGLIRSAPAAAVAPEARHSRFNRTLVLLLLGLLAGLVLLGALPRLFQQQALINHTSAQLAQAPSVSVAVARLSPTMEHFSLPGTTQAIQDAPVYARVDGYLHSRYVDIGSIVHQGQLLAEIDTPELDQQVQAAASASEQAKANLDNAKEAYEKAKADERTADANIAKARTDLQYYQVEVSRYKNLAQQGAVSLEDRDTRLQAYNGGVATLNATISSAKSAAAQVNAALAAVHVAEAAWDAAQAQHHQVEATRSFKKVTALFDGVITKSNVDAGALITSGSSTSNTVLFEIAKTDELRIYVNVPEQYVPDIVMKEQALVSFEEYPGKDFVGSVTNISGGLDADSKTLQVEVRLANADHKLLPGMYAQVKFEAPSLRRLALVPGTAVQTRDNGEYVYTVDNQQRVHSHRVTIGRDLGGQVEIAKGILAGQSVILSPSDDIQDGLLVAPVLASPSAGSDT